MAADRHPGITMHNLPVRGDFIGAVFAVGSALIFVIGFPTLWYFVALALALGVGVALFLKKTNHYHSEHNKPLSILQPDSTRHVPASPSGEKHRTLLEFCPNHCRP